MKRTIGILLAVSLAAGAGLAYAGKGGGGGGRGGGAHASAGGAGRPGMSGGFSHFTTGPMHFTTGQHWRPVIGRPPGVIGRPLPLPPRPVVPIHNHPGFVGGGTVIVTAPLWYPPYPYAYPYPYVAPAYGGSAYAEVPSYSDAPPNSDGYQERSDYWYYCPDSQAYYPYVSTCPSPWVQVLPEPDSSTN